MLRIARNAAIGAFCAISYVSMCGWFFFLPGSLFSSSDKRQVEELQRNRDWPKLLDLANEKTVSAPENASWWFQKGFALSNLGRYQESIPPYERAVRLQPQFPEALNNLGSARLRMGQYDAAIIDYESATKVNPDYETAWRNLVHAYSRAGKPDKAWDAQQTLARLHPANAAALKKQYLIPDARPSAATATAAATPAEPPAPEQP